MIFKKFILDKDHNLVEADLLTWARFFEDIKKRRVAYDKVGDVVLSSVFLGIDYNWGRGKPLLFETMIFGGKRDGETERYHTWKEAERGHKKILKELQAQ